MTHTHIFSVDLSVDSSIPIPTTGERFNSLMRRLFSVSSIAARRSLKISGEVYFTDTDWFKYLALGTSKCYINCRSDEYLILATSSLTSQWTVFRAVTIASWRGVFFVSVGTVTCGRPSKNTAWLCPLLASWSCIADVLQLVHPSIKFPLPFWLRRALGIESAWMLLILTLWRRHLSHHIVLDSASNLSHGHFPSVSHFFLKSVPWPISGSGTACIVAVAPTDTSSLVVDGLVGNVCSAASAGASDETGSPESPDGGMSSSALNEFADLVLQDLEKVIFH